RILGGTSATTTGGTGAAASLVDSPASQVREIRPPLADPSPTPAGARNVQLSDVSYTISVLGTQLIFNGTTFNQIRGTFFQRYSAYFAFRNILDQLIATVKTQFYQVVVNRELIKGNEQSERLMAREVKDRESCMGVATVR